MGHQPEAYLPNAPRKTSVSPRSNPTSSPTPAPVDSPSVTLSPKSVSELLKLKPSSPPRPLLVAEDTYLGHELWLPRSHFNAATLAYIGHGVYEDALLQQLVNANYLTKEESDILRRGRNVGSAKTRSRKRAGTAIYNRSSSLETLIGHLYLTNKDRTEEIMQKIGFSTGCSVQMILEGANSN